MYRLVKAVRRRSRRDISLWSWIFLGATALPYLYVLAFGRNMPWWVYIILGLLLAHGVYSLVQKRRAKHGAPAPPDSSG